MDTSKKEIRSTQCAVFMQEESRKIEGYALLFETESNMIGGSMIEKISRGALDGVIERSDVLCLMNHDEHRGCLARCRKGVGSLKLEVDERGLKYSFEAPNTPLGDELIESLKRGDVDSSSFAFTVKDDKWAKRGDGMYTRSISQIDRLYDVSPVYNPVYEDTAVSLRALGDLKEAERRKQEEVEKDLLNEYYKQVEERF